MTAKRVTILLSVSLIALIVGLVGGTYLLSGMLKDQSKTLADNKAMVAQLTNQETGIAKSKRDIEKYNELANIARAVVPQDKDQAATVREITRLAAASRIQLTTITFPSSTLGSTGTTTTPSAAANAAALAKPNLSQLTPVKGMVGVYNLQITLGNNAANTITYNQLISFLRGLENNRRTAAVSSISITPQADSPDRLTFNLIINTYIKP